MAGDFELGDAGELNTTPLIGRTLWDFVEAPSQTLEEWSWAAESLHPFAQHVETGEQLPADAVRKLKATGEFGQGLWVRQQMFYAALSLNLYSRGPNGLDPTKLVSELHDKYTPIRHLPDPYFHLAFGHLDGYSTIYYTYVWSLVMSKDMFTQFARAGLMSAEVAGKCRRSVLEPGGSDDAANLAKNFLGRDDGFDGYQQWLDAR